MIKEKHFLSKPAIWLSSSEFVDPGGEISTGEGESKIIFQEEDILLRSWVMLGNVKRENNYIIRKISESRYSFASDNPELGTQKGYFDINGNHVFSKFIIEETNLNGFEIIVRKNNTCHSSGALYEGDNLINIWTAEMTLKN